MTTRSLQFPLRVPILRFRAAPAAQLEKGAKGGILLVQRKASRPPRGPTAFDVPFFPSRGVICRSSLPFVIPNPARGFAMAVRDLLFASRFVAQSSPSLCISILSLEGGASAPPQSGGRIIPIAQFSCASFCPSSSLDTHHHTNLASGQRWPEPKGRRLLVSLDALLLKCIHKRDIAIRATKPPSGGFRIWRSPPYKRPENERSGSSNRHTLEKLESCVSC
jgi:hypothetical protein